MGMVAAVRWGAQRCWMVGFGRKLKKSQFLFSEFQNYAKTQLYCSVATLASNKKTIQRPPSTTHNMLWCWYRNFLLSTVITIIMAQTNPLVFELTSTCTGTVAQHAGLMRAYIIDKPTCEAAASALGLDDSNGAENTNKNNKHIYLPGCHWDGSRLYVDPTGLNGQRTAQSNQQALCALVAPCVEGQIIQRGQQCACTTGVTYHTRDKVGNFGNEQTVLCSPTALTDTVYCGSTGKQDIPKEVRCYPHGIGCAASSLPHFTKAHPTWEANDPMAGDYVYRGREINDFKTIRVASSTSLKIVALPFSVDFELYKNWNVAGWNPVGTRQKCYPDTTLPRFRGTGGPLFSVEDGATLTLTLLELAGVGTVQNFVGGGAVHVKSGTFVGNRVWFNGWVAANNGGAIHAEAVPGVSTYAIELKACEFGRALTIASNANYGFPNSAGRKGAAIYATDNQNSKLVFTCPPGKYQPPYVDSGEGPNVVAYDDLNAGCTESCPVDKGYYAPTFSERKQESDCGQCPAAYYCPDTLIKIACPIGRYAPAGSHDLTQCAACFPGKYVVDAGPPLVCGVCAAGMFRDSVSLNLNDVCTQCPTGRFALDHKSISFDISVDKSVAASFHNHLSDCLYCSKGSFFTSQTTECSVCRAAKYQDQDNVASVVCKSCPNGRVLTDNKATDGSLHSDLSNCLFCEKGKSFRNKIHSCKICEAGKYQDQDTVASAECQHCPTGRVVVDLATTATLHDAIEDCSFCEKGRYFINKTTKCSICTVGQFQNRTSVPSVQCTACPPGKTIGKAQVTGLHPSKHNEEDDCKGCSRGQFLYLPLEEGQGCQICPGGYYQEMYTGEIDSTTGRITLRCKTCRKGKFLRDDSTDKLQHMFERDCIVCEEGKFSPVGSRFCLICPAGYRTETVAEESSCVECPKGKFQQKPGQSLCDDCDPGMYQNVAGLPYCLPCIPGMYQTVKGGNKCLRCLPGQVAPKLATLIECTKCGAGRHSPVYGGTNCIKCQAGKFQVHKGEALCMKCEKGKFSVVEGNVAMIACTDCSRGKFSSERGREACQECLPGFVSHIGNHSCAACPGGWFEARDIKVEHRGCNACPAGKSSLEGQQKCDTCPMGKKNKKISGECSFCTAGRYQNAAGSDLCKDCPKGYFQKPEKDDEGSTFCSSCGAGFFSKKEGSTFCEACPRGFFQDLERWSSKKDSCGSCPQGYFASALKSTYCSSCDAGRYNEFESASECTVCPEGKYQDLKRSVTGCTACPAGYLPNKKTESTLCVKSPFLIPFDCLPNQYLDDSEADRLLHVCKKCIVGADCSVPRSALSKMRPLEGYRHLKGRNHTFGRCPAGKNACPKVVPMSTPSGITYNITCSIGHNDSSELCSQCLPNYAASSREQQCTICPDAGTTNVLFALTILFAVAVFSFLVYDNMDGAKDMVPRQHETEDNVIHYSEEMPFHSIVIRIVSSYLQIAGMLLKFDLTLPKEVASLVQVESSGGALGEQLLLFDCGTKIRAGMQMFMLKQVIAVWFFPVIGAVCCATFWLIYHLINKGKKDLFVSAMDGFVSSLMVLFFTLFPSLVNRLALTFSCQVYGDQLLVSEALSIKCFSQPHVDLILAVGIPGFIVFVFMIPTMLAQTLVTQRRAHTLFPTQKNYEHHWTLRLGFVYAGYKEGWEWWETVIMLRKCCFVMLAIFLRQYGPAPQVVAASIVLVIALSAHLQHMPYHDKEHSRLESIGLHACLLIILFTLLANLLGRDIDLEGRTYLGPTSTLLLTIFVFAVTIYFFAQVIVTTIRASQQTKGFVGNIAKIAKKIFGSRCVRPEKKKIIRLQMMVRASMFRRDRDHLSGLLRPPPPPDIGTVAPAAAILPPLPTGARRLKMKKNNMSRVGPKIHPKSIDGSLAQRAVQNHHMVQDVTKGLVKAIEAAEQTKHRVNAIHEKQHERLQKRVERQHSKRNKKMQVE